MKTTFLTLLAVMCFAANAQDQNAVQETEAASRAIQNSKGGNYKDILNGMFQLAFKSGDEGKKAFEFNPTLFAIAKEYDPLITQHASIEKLKFLKNFQINTKFNFSEDFDFDGYSAGFTLAIVNKRDKDLVDFNNTLLAIRFDELVDIISVPERELAVANLALAAPDPSLSDKFTEINEAILNGLAITPALAPTYAAIVEKADAKLAARAAAGNVYGKTGDAPISTTAGFVAMLSGYRTQYLSALAQKPLWTFTANGKTDTDGKFNQVECETIFLKGNKDNWYEIDLRAKLAYADTIAGQTPRENFNAKAGVNFKFQNHDEQKSVFEAKAYGEYNSIIKGLLPNEKREQFLANADLRLRIVKDVWLPITIKYDIENENFLGFLNVSYNFGG